MRLTLSSLFLLLLSVPLLGLTASGVPSRLEHVDDFRLIDHADKSQELYYYSDAKAVVLFIQGNDCPIVRKSIPEIGRLKNLFTSKGVVFLMLNANPQDSRKDLAREAAEDGIDIPILKDVTQDVARSLDATRTGEAILIETSHWNIAYRGPIDDSISYTAQKPRASRHYLEDAISSLLAGRRIESPQVSFMGCLISYPSPKPVSYADDVVPILKRKCMNCHYEGNKATWAMTSYEKISGWAPMIRETLRTGRMPPWGPDPEYGKFQDDASLSPGEMRSLLDWIEQGAQRGKTSDPLLAVRKPRSEWPLGEPDVILRGAESLSTPSSVTDVIRYISLPPMGEGDLLLQAAAIRPTDPGIVHHARLFFLPTTFEVYRQDKTAMEMEKLFQSDIGIAAFVGNMHLFQYPHGTAMRITGKRFPLLEVHYHLTGKRKNEIENAVQVGLYLYHGRRAARTIKLKILQDTDFRIPPHAKYEVTYGWTLKRGIEILTLASHMHWRGQSCKITAYAPHGGKRILLSIPNYDFEWQRNYMLTTPQKLVRGTKIMVKAVFDNSAQNNANPDPSQWLTDGYKTNDEMAMSYIGYVDAPDDVR